MSAPITVRYTRSRPGATMVGVGWLENNALTDNALKVGLWLSSHDPAYLKGMSQTAIGKRLGKSWRTVGKALDELEALGILRRDVVVDSKCGERVQITFDIGRWTSPPDATPVTNGHTPPMTESHSDPMTNGHTISTAVEGVGDISKEISRGELEVAPERKRNEVFDAMVDACGWDYSEMTDRQRRACGVASAELGRVGATPSEVKRRAAIYKRMFPSAILTPNAIANQWAAINELPDSGPHMNSSTAAFLRVASRMTGEVGS